jgi:hypothetical protein
VAIERALADAQFVGEHLQVGVGVAVLGKQANGRFEDFLIAAFAARDGRRTSGLRVETLA